jgi:hypothetical protein
MISDQNKLYNKVVVLNDIVSRWYFYLESFRVWDTQYKIQRSEVKRASSVKYAHRWNGKKKYIQGMMSWVRKGILSGNSDLVALLVSRCAY